MAKYLDSEGLKKTLTLLKGVTDAEQSAREAADTSINNRIDDIVADLKSYEITSVPASELETNVKEAFRLVDEDGTPCGPDIKIYKDSALQNVTLDGQELVFTYRLEDGTNKIVRLDVSIFLAESEFGDGLQVLNHIVSVKKDATSEGFLSVSKAGIKLSGIQDAINQSKSDAVQDYTGKINTLTTNLNKEIEDRKAADTAEATARSNADTTLTTNLNKEITDRKAADKTLQDNIDAEASARSSADTTLTTNLNKEISDRKAADTAEATTRANADTALDNKIKAITALTEAEVTAAFNEIFS